MDIREAVYIGFYNKKCEAVYIGFYNKKCGNNDVKSRQVGLIKVNIVCKYYLEDFDNHIWFLLLNLRRNLEPDWFT